MIIVEGKNGIKATVIKDSIAASNGKRLITYEIEFPRFILSEVNTHCMLEKNTASSRAIPVEAMLKNIEESPAMPVYWGENNPGMVSHVEMSEEKKNSAIAVWLEAIKSAISFSRILGDKNGINSHKQISNRITEFAQMSKTVITGTEWENFFWLRNHPDAQPEFQELAKCMFEAREKSKPVVLYPGEWHLPYVNYTDGNYYSGDIKIDLEQAKRISASCCAQVSYRKLNDSIEQAEKVFGMLNLGSTEKPSHASPVTHQATPMYPMEVGKNVPCNTMSWEDGVTHMRKDGSLWSGKLQGWIQYRQLFVNNTKW